MLLPSTGQWHCVLHFTLKSLFRAPEHVSGIRGRLWGLHPGPLLLHWEVLPQNLHSVFMHSMGTACVSHSRCSGGGCEPGPQAGLTGARPGMSGPPRGLSCFSCWQLPTEPCWHEWGMWAALEKNTREQLSLHCLHPSPSIIAITNRINEKCIPLTPSSHCDTHLELICKCKVLRGTWSEAVSP